MKSYTSQSLAAIALCLAGSAASSAVIFEGTHTFQEVDYIPFSAFGLTTISVCSVECYSDSFDTAVFLFEGSPDEMDAAGFNDDTLVFDDDGNATPSSDSAFSFLVLDGAYTLAVGGSILFLEDALDGVNEGERTALSSFRASFDSSRSVIGRYRVTITGDDVTLNLPVVEAPSPSQVPLPGGLPLLLAGFGTLGVIRQASRAT